ncbi:MAG: riboflavin biosynthesis protein RibF [Fibrobacter sp.]|jgi:riboflavin kinase/FMN adenylyltransferase|nr:riboflavin biosynthesis protein RibF [Fibrobacter sp.]
MTDKVLRAATVGNFDGCHLGHQQIFQILRNEAKAHGLVPTVISFEPHTRHVLGIPGHPALLTTTEEKGAFVRSLGLDFVALPFSREVAEQPYQTFIQNEILDNLNVKFLVLGHDHRFGAAGKGSFDAILQTFPELPAIQVSAKYKDGEVLSSSRIRDALEKGAVERATTFLGRPYRLHGIVVAGKRIGRTIGFPTANVQTGMFKLIPKYGAYAAVVRLQDGSAHRAVVNIGLQPSIGDLPLAVEAHILDFNADIYGQMIDVDLLTFIRAEQKFNSIDDLKRQIGMDADFARNY